MLYDIDDNGQEDVSFGNKASISETRTLKGVQPIHYGVNYHEEPLEFTLVFGSSEPIDRFEFERISMWLTGYQDYQWLQINQPDMDHVCYRCLVTELQPISVGWLPYAFKATILCDCPYAYGHYFENTYDVSGGKNFVFSNRGSVRDYFRPDLLIHLGSG